MKKTPKCKMKSFEVLNFQTESNWLTQMQLIGRKWIFSPTLTRNRRRKNNHKSNTHQPLCLPPLRPRSVYIHMICFHLHGQHRVITATITALQRPVATFISANKPPTKRQRRTETGHHGNEIKSWFGLCGAAWAPLGLNEKMTAAGLAGLFIC